MNDIYCVACGEPWDEYEARHVDMENWEYKLFKQGAGCPCCKGVPERDWEPSSPSDFYNGDDDPMDRMLAHENYLVGESPEWERPSMWIEEES